MNWEPYIIWFFALVAFPGAVIAWTWFWSVPAERWIQRYTSMPDTEVLYEDASSFRITRPAKPTKVRPKSTKPKRRKRA